MVSGGGRDADFLEMFNLKFSHKKHTEWLTSNCKYLKKEKKKKLKCGFFFT